VVDVAQNPKRAALTRERNRRRQPDQSPSRRSSAPVAASRRAAAASCGWCGGVIDLKATGRIPKWWSAACRQRAWEQSRAAASGRSAVEVVERVVEVPAERERAPRHEQWPTLLHQLTSQLDTGRIYARDLPELALALEQVAAAVQRRRKRRRPRR
jgi:hypothetical protein